MNYFNPHINLIVLTIIMPIDQMRTLKQKEVVKFDLEMKFLRSLYSKAVDLEHCIHFHALEKEMATHSSVLAWRIPGTEEPGGLPSMGSHRVRHE